MLAAQFAMAQQKELFTIEKLDINTEKYSSFGAVLTNDNNFYFTSSRNTARRTFSGNEQPFLDM